MSEFTEHAHEWRLMLWRGRIVAACECGDMLEYDEVERRLNALKTGG